MDKNDKVEVSRLTPEEQEKMEKAQMVCDTLVTEMEMRIHTDKKHFLDSSTLIEVVEGDDLELAEIVQSAMMMTKGYFRYHGDDAIVSYTGRHNEEKELQHEFKIEVQHRQRFDEDPEITSKEQ